MAALFDEDNVDLLGEGQPGDDLDDFFAPELPTIEAFAEEDDAAAGDGGYDPAAEDAADEEAAEQQQQEEEEQQQQQQAPVSDAKQEAAERRARLLQLAKRQAAGGGDDDEAPRKKKHRKDKDRQAGEQRSGRPKRLRQQAGGDDGEGQQQQQQRARGREEPELPEDAYEETAEDRQFIDDEGVPEDMRYEGDDLEVLAAAEEAEEALPGQEEYEPGNIVDEVLARRKRRKKDSEQDLDYEVVNLVSQMHACADKDNEVMNAGAKQPAMEKFKALPEVNRMLRQRKYHDTFLMQGGLRAMAAWLRPYGNGELPNTKIRCVLVELLGLMALDTSNDYTRDKLEESELGKLIMFYFRNPLEKNMALRSKCRDLVQAWSAPIFADADEEQRKRRQREREHRLRMVAERPEREQRERREAEEAERRRTAQQGQEGFRARAAVPQPSRLDFVINPGSKVDPLEAAMRGGPAGGSGGAPKAAKNKSPIGGRLGKLLQQRKRGTQDRFGGVSVEGRSIQM